MEHDGARPVCGLLGTDGNVFSVIHAVDKTLKQAGLKEQAAEFVATAMRDGGRYDVGNSYDAVLRLCSDYVEVQLDMPASNKTVVADAAAAAAYYAVYPAAAREAVDAAAAAALADLDDPAYAAVSIINAAAHAAACAAADAAYQAAE